MDNQEYENPVQPQQPVQPEPQPQPEAAPAYQWQPPQQGDYYASGAGQAEQPFAGSPYITYYYPPQGGYRQPWQQNYQQPPQSPKKKEKKAGKIVLRIVAAVLVVVLILAGCGATALYLNGYWQQQNAVLKQYFEEKIAVLEQELEDARQDNTPGVGELAKPGENLTASEIYQQNVASVVAVTAVNIGSGTGFIWSADGYIITNHHVIEGATAITVTMYTGESYNAVLIGSDAANDVALLKIHAVGLQPVTVGSSTDMRVGDQVVAIGNALGELTSSLTVGYVSGTDRNVSTDGTIINMIQIDAAINSGNSGGPLFNARGEVIGINSAKYSGTTTSGASIEGIGFAIPMDDVVGILEDLRDYGYVRSAYLGVTVRDMDPAVANAYGLPMGVYVDSVTAGYCAAAAGVRPKDIITSLGGYDVDTINDLSRALRQLEAGQTVTITVWRSGQEAILTITLDEKPFS